MALSFVSYTGDGSNRNFSFPHPYISKDDVSVSVDGVTVTFTWLSDSMVQTTVAPTLGTRVLVRRVTQKAEPLVDFEDASTLTEADLDTFATQMLYIAQEASDLLSGAIVQDVFGRFDAINKRIINLADPVAATDAVNKQYGDEHWGAVAAAAAAASAAAAAASAASADADADDAVDAKTYVEAQSKRFLSPSATDPTTRDDGSALQNGDQYYNTVDQLSRFYISGAWRGTAASAADMTPDSFTATGSSAEFTLTRAPGTASNLLVWVGGVRQRPITDYTVAGTTLTIISMPTAGQKVDTLAVASVLPVAGVGSGSIDADKLASNAVTTVKVNDGAITNPKLGAGAVDNAKVATPGNETLGIASSKLTFTPTAGGYIRSVQTRLREIVDARDFGVKADGATNDTTALLAAIAAAKDVVLPAGNLVVTGTAFAFAMHGQRIRGAGQNLTTVTFTGSGSVELFKATLLNDVVLSDLTINQNNANGNCFNFRDCYRPIVERVTLMNAPSGSSLASFQQGSGAGCVGAVLRDSYLLNAGNHGLEISLGSQCRAINNRMENITWAGVNVAGSHYAVVEGNTIVGNLDASGYGGIRLSNGPTSALVSGNTIINSSRGLMILGTSFSNFSNNVIVTPYHHGIFMQCNNTGPNTSCNGNVVSGNMIRDPYFFGGTNNYAIELSSDGTPGASITYNEIIGNIIIDTRGPQHTNNAIVNSSGQTNYFDNNRWNTAA